jgi:hypothetical protein
MSLYRSFKFAFALRPLAVTVPAAMVPIGIATLALGSEASRAFSLIPGGSLIAHVLGLLLFLGGVLTIAGTVRLGTFCELIGLVFVSTGSFLYAGGVIIGLGVNGLIAGGAYAAITVGCAGRVVMLGSLAHKRTGEGGSL